DSRGDDGRDADSGARGAGVRDDADDAADAAGGRWRLRYRTADGESDGGAGAAADHAAHGNRPLDRGIHTAAGGQRAGAFSGPRTGPVSGARGRPRARVQPGAGRRASRRGAARNRRGRATRRIAGAPPRIPGRSERGGSRRRQQRARRSRGNGAGRAGTAGAGWYRAAAIDDDRAPDAKPGYVTARGCAAGPSRRRPGLATVPVADCLAARPGQPPSIVDRGDQAAIAPSTPAIVFGIASVSTSHPAVVTSTSSSMRMPRTSAKASSRLRSSRSPATRFSTGSARIAGDT